MFWVLAGCLIVGIGVAFLFNLAGIAETQASNLKSLDKILGPIFSKIPPWSFFKSSDVMNPASSSWVYRIQAYLIGLVLIVGGVLLIVVESGR